jgi:hypothetical protein
MFQPTTGFSLGSKSENINGEERKTNIRWDIFQAATASHSLGSKSEYINGEERQTNIRGKKITHR